jgi:hypothetical protein
VRRSMCVVKKHRQKGPRRSVPAPNSVLRVADARPSNAGDRYHLAYVARLLLQMLHPSSDLRCVTIENVAPADQSLAIDERSFLAADVTEYRGGENSATAHKITLTQVKYSPLRPKTAWTLARLIRNDRSGDREKPRTSVLRKLADMLRPYARIQTNRPHLVVRLLTNQPISSQLCEDLTNLKSVLADTTESIGEILERVSKSAKTTAHRMKRALEVGWQDLAALIRCWDLSTFSQPSLFVSEAALFRDFSGIFAEARLRLGYLFGELQQASTPHGKVEFTRTDALASLGLQPYELDPAPSMLEDEGELFDTAASTKVREAFDKYDGIIVVHGRTGVGKTSALIPFLPHSELMI